MLVDHLIYAHPDLGTAVAFIEALLGVRAEGGGSHPGRGTHNTLLALGGRTYLEIIAPDPDQPEPGEPRPYGVAGVERGGLVGWALATEDLDAAIARARSLGFDPGGAAGGRRVDRSGALLTWRVTQNAATGGLVPFLISWGATPHPAAGAPQGPRLISVRIEHPEPEALRTPLAALGAEVEVRRAPRPALVARIDGPRGEQELR